MCMHRRRPRPAPRMPPLRSLTLEHREADKARHLLELALAVAPHLLERAAVLHLDLRVHAGAHGSKHGKLGSMHATLSSLRHAVRVTLDPSGRVLLGGACRKDGREVSTRMQQRRDHVHGNEATFTLNTFMAT